MISVQAYYCIFFTCHYYSVGQALPMNEDSAISKEVNKSLKLILRNEITLTNINGNYTNIIENMPNIRVKRQSSSGAGKFVEAAKMPQLKLLRLLLQMFKNSWDSAYVGGAHPLHPNVPKTIVALYKEKVVEFFIPDVGDDPKKQSS